MKVTVCELRNEPTHLEQDWQGLVDHVQSAGSNLVLLPEMPFYPWIARHNDVDDAVWKASVETHDQWVSRLTELKTAVVVSTRPIMQKQKKFNEGFIWDSVDGYKGVHRKRYLPDDEGWWEASWYDRGNGDFSVVQSKSGKIGFLICTELWFNAHARDYAKQGAELIVTPRATEITSIDKWIAGGRTAAVVSGAYSLSSNYSYGNEGNIEWGGGGWIIEPEEGQVLGVTSREHPFLTLDIDLNVARHAKRSYPRNVIG